jgi:diguanylate cyclase (GGDEF)-like protein
MGASHLEGIDVTGGYKILRLLDALRASPAGVMIYHQVEHLLKDQASCHQQIQHGCVTLVKRLLDSYVGHLDGDSTLRVQIRLLQARLDPPLSVADLAALEQYIDLYAAQIELLPQADTGLLQDAIAPLLEAFGIATRDKPANQAASESEPVLMHGAAGADEVLPAVAVVGRKTPDRPEQAGPVSAAGALAAVPAPAGEPQPALSSGVTKNSDRNTVTEYPQAGDGDSGEAGSGAGTPIESGKRDILQLQSELARQVLETISQNEEFGVLLEVVLGELRRSVEGKELEDLRWTLIREIEKLTRGHHELAEKLDNTHHYLQLVESDSRQLSDELSRVRLLSLTDELTGLPNRRAFLRRIEDEVARVQRYGFPLSLALIDLDHFKQINDRYGHSGGDEVLRIYSKNILSIFRHHDLVARYGGEEFAVLLPNTREEGSMRALNKVKARAGETRWQFNDEMISVPTFSSGVSLYKPGETASAFIERADKALYRAKRLGRNRVELDATYRSNVEAPEAEPVADS